MLATEAWPRKSWISRVSVVVGKSVARGRSVPPKSATPIAIMSVWLRMKIATPFLKRSHASLIAAAVIIPVILFVGAALKSREDVLREGEDEVTRSIADVGDNVHVALDTERRTSRASMTISTA